MDSSWKRVEDWKKVKNAREERLRTESAPFLAARG